MKHECKTMKRLAQMKSIDGQRAFIYYETWMKLQGRRIGSIDTFIRSNFFLAFIRFAVFVKEMKLSSASVYIRLMVKRNFMPTMWTANEVYVIYIKHFDYLVSPLEQAEITVDTLFDISESMLCDTGDIFDRINPNILIEQIKQRKVSPWVLLNSKKFFNFLVNLKTININQYTVIEALLEVKHWKERFKKNRTTVSVIKKIVRELNL